MIRAIVVIGVTGSGKSTLGMALADALHWRFVEGDTLHSPASIAKMASGVPLNDLDRQPLLDGVARAIFDSHGDGIVISCSALKRSYRDRIGSGNPPVLFVLPMLTAKQLAARLAGRSGHFMPASMLDSQLATFEPLQNDELAVQIPGEQPLASQVDLVLKSLKALAPDAAPRT